MTEGDYAEIAGKAYYLKGDMEYVFFYNEDGVYYTHWKPYDKLDPSQFCCFIGKPVPVEDFNGFVNSIKFGNDFTSQKGESFKHRGNLLFPSGYNPNIIVNKAI